MLNSILMATVGGALIGLAASLLLWGTGKIAGISGILGSLFRKSNPDRTWRMLFILGLLFGGLITLMVAPSHIAEPSTRSPMAVAVAGLMVGFGTRLGNGCTSGHGVCGLSRFSKRSLFATLSFMTTGFMTATLIQWVWGGQL
jgi:hypothetical protein